MVDILKVGKWKFYNTKLRWMDVTFKCFLKWDPFTVHSQCEPSVCVLTVLIVRPHCASLLCFLIVRYYFASSLFVIIVRPQLTSSLCVLILRPHCVPLLCILIVRPHCASSLCVIIVRPYCAFSLCVLIERPHCASSFCVLIVRPYCASWLCVLSVRPHCPYSNIIMLGTALLNSYRPGSIPALYWDKFRSIWCVIFVDFILKVRHF